MAITIDPATFIISVPKSFMTLVQSLPFEIYELDSNAFRNALNDWADSEDGMYMPDTNRHNTEVTIDGLTYARTIEILDPYSITFEDGQYQVNITGSNNNIHSKRNLNQVSIVPHNSAGLINVKVGDPWATDLSTYNIAGTAGKLVKDTLSLAGDIDTKVSAQVDGLTPNQLIMLQEIYALYGLDMTKPLVVTDTSRTAGTISQQINSNAGSTTVTRV
jgi:hypothetical protein